MNLLRNPRTRVFLKGALALTLVANFATVTWASIADNGYDVGRYCYNTYHYLDVSGETNAVERCIATKCHTRATPELIVECSRKANWIAFPTD
jgi:hypothetical protein